MFCCLCSALVVIGVFAAIALFLVRSNPNFLYNATRSYGKLAFALEEYLGIGRPVQITPALVTQWLKLTKDTVFGCERAQGSLRGGYTGDLYRLNLMYDGQKSADSTRPSTLVVKSSRAAAEDVIAVLLLRFYREAQFYQNFHASSFPIAIPAVYHSSYSLFSRRLTIVMEDLQDGMNASPFLGNQCWGTPNLPADAPSPDHIMDLAIDMLVKLHSRYWNDQQLMQMPWLKGVQWMQGQNRVRYELSKKLIKEKWETVKTAATSKRVNGRDYTVNWSPRLIALIDECIAHTTWAAFQAHRFPNYSLVHGDFHAANLLYRPRDDSLVAVDWPEVGVGEPATELAQIIISNITIQERRAKEMAWIKAYHAGLVAKGIKVSFEEVLDGYRRGGIDRWTQLLIILACMGIAAPHILADNAIQWFHDQVSTFVDDHASFVPNTLLLTGYCMPK